MVSARRASRQSESGGTRSSLAWAPVLATPGVRFVDLQYGDTAPETGQSPLGGSANLTVDTAVSGGSGNATLTGLPRRHP